MSLNLGPCSTSLQSPLYLSPCYTLLHHRPKSHSSALSGLDCPLIHQQKIRLQAPTAYVADQRQLFPSGKPDGPVWHSGLSEFPVLEPSCPVGGRHSRNDRLLCSSLCGQNPHQVLTITDGSALVAESMDRTTPPQVDKADTSSTEAPTTQALVARLGSKAPNDAPIDDDPDLLNFTAAVSWTGCWTSFLPQKYWSDPGKPDGPIWETRWSDFHDP
jgi:hypothetical protein